MSSKMPSKEDYKMPAEWHIHSGTQMHWPINRKTWPGKRLQKVEKIFLEIIEILHRYEPIHLFVNDEKIKDHVLKLFESRNIIPHHSSCSVHPIIFHLQPTDDVWARDCGPIFVREVRHGDEKFAITDWKYNAWGGKYPPFDADNALPKYVADTFNIKRYQPGMVLEGGSIETNGDGVLLTTESVLLNANRNPHLSQAAIEERLKKYLGIEKIIWLKKGLAGDDTDGHIDDLARFLNQNTILVMICEKPEEVNFAVLQDNLQVLHNATNHRGEPFQIETLPLPETSIAGTTVDGSRHVPASYANFYVANGVVLVPLYDERYDPQAMTLFEHYFPDRTVCGVPCADLVWGQGSIHCITREWYAIPEMVVSSM